MRLIGAAERGMQIMAERALSRTVFRKLIAEQGSFRSDIAKVMIKLHPLLASFIILPGSSVIQMNQEVI